MDVEAFYRWVDRHCSLILRRDWPALDAEFWQGHRRSLARHGVDEALASAASDVLVENPPRFLDAHLTALLTAVEKVRSSQRPPAIVVAARTDEAREEADYLAWLALADDDRESWRAAVRDRFPELAHRAAFVEPIAITWAADPDRVLPPRPPLALRRPRRSYAWSTGQPEPNDAGPSPPNTPEPPAF